jgi:hypothetical protein
LLRINSVTYKFCNYKIWNYKFCYWALCVAILWWCFDYIRHFRVNSSTSESTDCGILFQAERIIYKVSVYISCGTFLLGPPCPWELTILRQLGTHLSWTCEVLPASYRVTYSYPRYSPAHIVVQAEMQSFT